MVWDRGTRDLLPFLATDPDEIFGPEAELPARPSGAGEGALPSSPQGTYQAAALPAMEDEAAAGVAVPLPGSGQPSAIASIHVSQAPGPGVEVDSPTVTIAQDHGLAGHLLSWPLGPRPAGSRSDDHDGPEERPEHNSGAPDPAGRNGGDLKDAPDGVHTIKVTQLAEVDQDASIIVQGYVGEVVARLHIDQDLMMDQDVDISFTIDGDGHFSVLLDQDMRISQSIDIDVDIYDTDGVLYIDVFLSDSIEVEQATTLDAHIGDGPPGGTVEVDQDLELEQDVDIDIDIDIEDDLEERYIIKVAVETVQLVDADQDVVVDIANIDGGIDMDVDATQTVAVDQETIVRADFALA